MSCHLAVVSIHLTLIFFKSKVVLAVLNIAKPLMLLGVTPLSTCSLPCTRNNDTENNMKDKYIDKVIVS